MAEFESGQLRQWAIKGAEQRLQEIAAEAAAIYQAFPELRDRGQRAAAPAAAVTAAAKRGGRANMSPAQRKAVSERMRKYWAARREGAGGATSAASAKASPARAAKKSRGPRQMSAAARKRISDAQKKRWAQRRANG